MSKRYTMDISRRPVARLQQQPAAARVDPQARLDERVARDRPVQLRPDALRHRRHPLRHHPADQLGHRTPPFTIKPMAKGLEETAVLDLASPPIGRAAGQRARRHRRLLPRRRSTRCPANFHDTPSLSSNTSLDFAELSPTRLRPGRQRRRGAAHRHLHRRRQELVPGPGAVRGDRRRHGRGRRRRRLRSSGRRPAPASTTRPPGAARGPRPAGLPDRRGRRVRPGQPQDLLRVRGGQVLHQHGRRRHLHRLGAPPCPRPARLHLHGRAGRRAARSGWPAPPACCARPTPAPRSPRSSAVTSGINVAFGKAAPGATHPAVFLVGTVGGVTGRLPLRRHRHLLGADQRRRPPVRQRRRRAGRRPARLRPGLPGHQRPRHPLRRPAGRPHHLADHRPRRRPYAADPAAHPSPTARHPHRPPTSPSPTPPPTPPPTAAAAPPPTRSPAQWGGGFQGEVTVKNTGTAATKAGPSAGPSRAGQTIAPDLERHRHPVRRRRHGQGRRLQRRCSPPARAPPSASSAASRPPVTPSPPPPARPPR